MELRIPSTVLQKIRDELVQEDELERFAYLSCGRSGEDFVLNDVHFVEDENLEIMERGACRPDIGFERDVISTCFYDDLNPVMTHSHPFSIHPGFSGIDVSIMDEYRDWLAGLYPDEDFGFAVVGEKGLQTTVYRAGQEGFDDLPVNVIGDWVLDDDWKYPVDRSVDSVELDGERFDRNIRALTEEGQRQLAETTAGIVGCGGIGSILCEELARLGVQDFILIDPDVVEESNLSRLVGAYPEHVGRSKVEVMKQHLWRVSPDCDVTTVESRVEEAGQDLLDADVLIAGVDKVSARSFLNELAVRHLKPYIDAGVVINRDENQVTGMDGFIQTVVPGVNACFDCLERGDPEQARIENLSEDELEHEIEQGYIEESELTPEPAVVHLNGTIASMAVQEFSKLVTGFDAPTDFIRYEGVGHELVPIKTSPNAECVTCGEDGLLGRGEMRMAGNLDDVDNVDYEVPEL